MRVQNSKHVLTVLYVPSVYYSILGKKLLPPSGLNDQD